MGLDNDVDKEEESNGIDFPKYERKDLETLCGQYAAYTRVNLAEEHGQIVTQIATMEEQLHTFSQLIEAISSSNSGVKFRKKELFVVSFSAQIGGPEGLALAQVQWEKMQPPVLKVDAHGAHVRRTKESWEDQKAG